MQDYLPSAHEVPQPCVAAVQHRVYCRGESDKYSAFTVDSSAFLLCSRLYAVNLAERFEIPLALHP